jgi:serine/threonine protein kinase
MVHVFQAFRHLLGPSLLTELSKYLIVEESKIEKYVNINSICETVLKTIGQVKSIQAQKTFESGDYFENNYALQHIEYLEGGEFLSGYQDKNTKYFAFYVFSLVWFMVMSRKAFGFRHRDLKSGNIIFRKTKTIVEYNFVLESKKNKMQYYHFESQYVPVIIDYDFATTTQSLNVVDRNVVGTRYSAPPDVLLEQLSEAFDQKYKKEMYQEAYDWWSLGVCILELHFRGAITFFQTECDAFAKRILSRIGYRYRSQDLYFLAYGLFYSCCLASIFSNTSSSPLPPTQWYDNVEYFFGKTMQDMAEISMHRNPEYQMLQNWFVQKKDTYFAVHFLSKLLHWDPHVRDLGGRPEKYLTYFKKLKSTEQPRPNARYEFRGSKRQAKIDLNTTQFPFLRTSLCSNCFIESKLMCSCCKNVFCSVECQKVKH